MRWHRRFARLEWEACALGALSALLLAAASAPRAAATAREDSDTDWLARIPKQMPGAEPLPEALRHRLARGLRDRGPGYLPRTRNLRPDGSPLYSNRLLLETSPYLLQHAHNPVDWRPWGPEAFEAARRLRRPVMVSIGYSTCHWCHVMEEESFDDPEIAELMNANFIAIKVDREVRPDIDGIYMSAVQAITGRGGWPLNVWLTPDREPFYGGTYFPPVDRGNRAGLPTVLRAIAEQYRSDPQRIAEISEKLAAVIAANLEGVAATGTQIPDPSALRSAARTYAARVDRTWGGIGSRTKFPALLPIRFLLRYHRRTGDADALQIVVLTLDKMMRGGLYDQVGGGFHRYSTDRRWLVPHFEKMLYDNALLASAFLEAWQATGKPAFSRVTRETLDYLGREMSAPGGGFYSATDADSPGPHGEPEEGRFFTWTPQEIEAAIDAGAARAVIASFGVTTGGDLEGRSILRRWREPAQLAGELDTSEAQLAVLLAKARRELYRARSRRPAPGRDEKVLVAWNGLAISAFARAAFALDEDRYRKRAAAAADFILSKMREDGALRRVFTNGRADGPAFLEDYAFLIAGLLDLYEADPDPRWLREAIALQGVLDGRYADGTGGAYFQSAHDQERLIAREKPNRDGALPSGNSVAALNLLRLSDLTNDDAYLASAAMLFSAFAPILEDNPTQVSELLLALDYRLDTSKEIVVVVPKGGGAGPALAEMLAPLREALVPNRVLSVVTEGADLEAHAALLPWVRGRVPRKSRVTAYVCENRICDLPTSDPKIFAKQFSRIQPLAGVADAPSGVGSAE